MLTEIRKFAANKWWSKWFKMSANDTIAGVLPGRMLLHHLTVSLNGASELVAGVEACLDHGAHAEVCNAQGCNVILVHVCECVPSPALVQLLLACAPAAAKGSGRFGRSALHYLAQNASAVRHGGDVVGVVTPDGVTAAAAVEEVARLLVAAGAPGWDERDRMGNTPPTRTRCGQPNPSGRAELCKVAFETQPHSPPSAQPQAPNGSIDDG